MKTHLCQVKFGGFNYPFKVKTWMKRLPTALVLLTILVLPLSVSYNSVLTEDCFVQIVSVTLNQSSLEIGERLQVNLVYDLYYDQMDPLGIGSVSVSISIQGTIITLSSFEFTDLGLDVHKIITFEISPNEWTPNETGQVGIVQIEGWVQDSIGSMTDSVQQQFSIDRSDLLLEINPLQPQITFHENLILTGALHNPHNSSLYVPNHPLMISIIQNNQTLQSWSPQTNLTNNFTQSINSTLLGTGDFYCRISALDSNDYRATNSTVSFYIANANLSFSVTLNTTTIQAYYPSMSNCSILVSAYLHCQVANHTFGEANVTCFLGNRSKTMTYIEPNHFFAEIIAPSLTGDYFLAITALAPNHAPVNTSIPLNVVCRQAQLSFTTNCSEAAYGDFIEFSLNVVDISSQVPIPDKICSIYFYNQSVWNLLTQVILDQNGWAQFYWQAQNVGNEDYRFKAVFQGSPEFDDAETEVMVTNTHDLRFFCNSTLYIVRPNDVDYTLQLTTLDFQPIINVSVKLVEITSNITWCISFTNTSGYAILSWSIDENFTLGLHEFFLTAQDGLTTLGKIQITMIVYEQTILKLL